MNIKLDKQVLKESMLRLFGFIVILSLLFWTIQFIMGDFLKAPEKVKDADEEFLIRFVPAFIIMWVGISA